MSKLETSFQIFIFAIFLFTDYFIVGYNEGRIPKDFCTYKYFLLLNCSFARVIGNVANLLIFKYFLQPSSLVIYLLSILIFPLISFSFQNLQVPSFKYLFFQDSSLLIKTLVLFLVLKQKMSDTGCVFFIYASQSARKSAYEACDDLRGAASQGARN